MRVVVAPDRLAEGVRRLAGEIAADHPDGVLLVAVLKGSVPFLADLVRLLDVAVEVDFLAISAYSEGSGRVRIVKDLDIDVHGRDVVLVEDIVDTGLTLGYVMGELLLRGPRRLSACTLLDRRGRRILPTPLAYVGFEIDDDFALGYGLDFEGRYRNLDHVLAGDLAVLRDDPDAYVARVFGG